MSIIIIHIVIAEYRFLRCEVRWHIQDRKYFHQFFVIGEDKRWSFKGSTKVALQVGAIECYISDICLEFE